MSRSDVAPEPLVSVRQVFDGRLVQVHVDRVGLAAGGVTDREVVEHQDSVVVVPVDAEGNVILVRQYRHPAREALLEAPAGKIDGSDSPDETAQRELQEEAGVRSANMRKLGEFWVSPGYCTELMHAFHASDLSPSRLEPDPDETIETVPVPVSRIRGMIREGGIRDGKTIAALLMSLCMDEDV